MGRSAGQSPEIWAGFRPWSHDGLPTRAEERSLGNATVLGGPKDHYFEFDQIKDLAHR